MNEISTSVNLCPGQNAFASLPPGFAFIEKGIVKLSLKVGEQVRTIEVYGQGEYIGFGDWQLQSPPVYISLGTSRLSFVSLEKFEAFAGENPSVFSEVCTFLLKKQIHAFNRLWTLQFGSSESKVAATLLTLERRFFAQIGQPLFSIIDRQTLAELSGTAIETLSRILTRWENAGVLQRKGRALNILKEEELSQRARTLLF